MAKCKPITGSPVKGLRSIRVTIDNTLSFDDHIDNVCKAADCHIRALKHIRLCASLNDAKAVAVATVLSQLDYCNPLLYEMSLSNLSNASRMSWRALS